MGYYAGILILKDGSTFKMDKEQSVSVFNGINKGTHNGLTIISTIDREGNGISIPMSSVLQINWKMVRE